MSNQPWQYPPSSYGGPPPPPSQPPRPPYGAGGWQAGVAGMATGPRIASFGSRLGARLIDGIAVSVLAFVLLLVLLIGVFLIEPSARHYTSEDFDTAVGVLILFGLGLVVFFYDWFCHIAWGRTLGKALLGLKVVRTDGGRVRQGQTAGRAAVFGLPHSVWVIGWVFLLIDCAWVLADTSRAQALHDKMCHTLVIRTRDS
ncbi:RDD family protein [Salinactinospora qingdaonensis]|uniref:RDD domain-containing protein n=1 Tax=Salinactinospora qingdaonensis TaxID=702744 RepID=A0ABP7FLV5_9ACTN